MAALPAAPLYGAALSYLVYHPPRRPHHKKPADLGLTSSDVVVPLNGDTGRGIHVWLCPGDPGRVVVMGHGLGLSKSASLAQAKLLNDAGYTVALFDHRNHGKSGADRACWSMSDRHTADVVAVVRHMRARPEHATARIAVYGFSISTFPSLYMLRKADECPVDAVVFDSGPAVDLRPLFRNFIAAGGLPVPRPLRTGSAGRTLEKVFSSVATAMLRVQWPPPVTGAYESTPMLFLTGERDSIIPAPAVRGLAERFPRAEVHELPDTEHLLGIKTHPKVYAETVLDFLQRTLKG
ncbi:alpha/beta hydrolase [Streptomyces sp. LX-29]|uniref:alpha/beta hydrolase n=1 Tax=unclassified Streptomyces TaxID=2593676 RepID=UPI001185B264|nr:MULTISPECIES: alpha/beta fold hydrolase [unclassified Streptomyces]TVL87418.1 alpha/beta hydrolase [Streptomyces sp. SAJ15]WFB09341.1 alpha/beta hydrolase [Streptomyces sp. LX-29]